MTVGTKEFSIECNIINLQVQNCNMIRCEIVWISFFCIINVRVIKKQLIFNYILTGLLFRFVWIVYMHIRLVFWAITPYEFWTYQFVIRKQRIIWNFIEQIKYCYLFNIHIIIRKHCAWIWYEIRAFVIILKISINFFLTKNKYLYIDR